ncbi:MAG: hypothetical protein FD161_624 [Limisphaerales bacterium]|nr:MAG: hypothetical protein FD161_624 [Limisphaerales bacterium]KAG0510229.1 MAG: hypothetical protein E1N63_624 [Limisphaerales bacterium]TXT51888.1 MAG: hypothetical protein FD140_1276 [Limisphaerales bacterium]
MKDELIAKLDMFSAVKTYLQVTTNKALWFNLAPTIFTTLEGQFETAAGNLGAFGDSQSALITGVTDQQNAAEKALEDAAHPLGRALRLLFIAQNNLEAAAPWDLSLSDWRKMQETALLNRAKALHTALLPHTTGTPPAGEPYGIIAAATTALNTKIAAYENVIGAPASARSTRKAKTADLRPRFRAVDVLLEGMDDLIIQITGTEEKDLFVDGYFNARRIGGGSSDGGEEAEGGENGGGGTAPPPNNLPPG